MLIPHLITKQSKIARESPGCEDDINCFRRYSLGGGELGVLCKLLDNKFGTMMKDELFLSDCLEARQLGGIPNASAYTLQLPSVIKPDSSLYVAELQASWPAPFTYFILQ